MNKESTLNMMLELYGGKLVYHGSDVVVKDPKIIIPSNPAKFKYKDFGFGFYCTEILKQSEAWAV